MTGPTPGKLGLVAGGGPLPVALAERCRAAGRPLFVVRLKGFAGEALQGFEGAEAGLAEFGRIVELLRKAGCESLCFAGTVARPDFAALKPDLKGLRHLAGAAAAARKGDDALLRYLLGLFEAEGFRIEAADTVDAALLLPEGALGRHRPRPEHAEDAGLALAVARAMGALDIGQAAVTAKGLVLAVEAQEGTAAMLRRCADLPAALRGSPADRQGVLAKAPKPIQERRVDLPVIGPETIELAAEAGLAGVVGEARGVLMVERPRLIETADRLGLFVLGMAPDPGAAGP